MKRVLKWVLGLLAVVILMLAVYASTFVVSYDQIFSSNDPLLMMDNGRLDPQEVAAVDRPTRIAQLQAVLADARARHLKVSIAGSQHSQGGQTYYPGGVVINMKDFDQVLALDTKAKTITVESGATWDQVQQYINPYGLAVKVMQSSYVFTIGGTLSADAHGRGLDETAVVETVKSFHLMLADGSIVNVSRTERPELFKLVIGGYGLFGIILDATIQLTDDDVYAHQSVVLNYKDFPAYFDEYIRSDPNVSMMLVRPSIDPRPDKFMEDLVVSTWVNATTTPPADVHVLGHEENVLRDKFFFGLSRKFDWAKELRWWLQEKLIEEGGPALISRNNAMRPPETPLEFLDYYSSTDTDIIQEYFVPEKNFVPFMDEFRQILLDGHMNVISSTIRYVKANDETYLSYMPKEDGFSVIQMSNVGLSKDAQAHAEAVTQQLVDLAIKYDGSYYLTYQLYPTKKQMYEAYPNAPYVFQQKFVYDPESLFDSEFYEKYK
ncbi:MAG TPA: FAD-binding oxidoreductase [Candidatus Paceibacterota bacterium]|nr:FAD-binding oxidoreductase [Candidatus Paceibacterota bacterium]